MHGNYSYLLIDTAGIRRKGKTTEKLEKFSILKALAALERCDVAMVLIDAEEGITEQDTKVIGYTLDQGRGLIILVNKWDLVDDDKKRQEEIMAQVGLTLPFVGYAPVLNSLGPDRLWDQAPFSGDRPGLPAVPGEIPDRRPQQTLARCGRCP